jgi:hypothetical protein
LSPKAGAGKSLNMPNKRPAYGGRRRPADRMPII